MATSMTAEIPAADSRVRKPVRTPKPPPNSAMIANKVKIGGIPSFSSKVLNVPVNPWPPKRANSFWEPCAMKIRPRGIRSMKGANKSVASKLLLAMGNVSNLLMNQPAFAAMLDSMHELIRLADNFVYRCGRMNIRDCADTETNRPAPAGHRLFEGVMHLMQAFQRRISLSVRHQDNKFIAAEAGQNV